MRKTILLTQIARSDLKLAYHPQGYYSGLWCGDQFILDKPFEDAKQQFFKTHEESFEKIRALAFIRFNQYAEIYKL